jgi:hypothetical protein
VERSKNLADRLREVLLNGHWIANTNFKEQIEAVSWEQATLKVGNLNTIAALTYHVNYYLAGILNVLNGGDLEIRDKFSYDMPPVRSELDWEDLINGFMKNAEEFARRIEHMSDAKLEKPFVDVRYGTYLRNIEGVIEHSYYHLGQISLIRKMILENDK